MLINPVHSFLSVIERRFRGSGGYDLDLRGGRVFNETWNFECAKSTLVKEVIC